MDYKYQILYRGQLAVKKLSRIGARKMATKLMKEKGWAPSDIQIVLAPTAPINQGGN